MGRYEQILAAAEKLFYERSFDGVGVDEIGKAAGVSGSSIYWHFRGKDEILATLFDRMIDALLLRMGEPADDPRRELEQLIGSFVEFTVRYEKLAAIWVREQHSQPARYRGEFHRRRRILNERWKVCLHRLYPERSEDEIVSTVRAVQFLIMSEALRPPGATQAANIEELLTDMALVCVTVLERPIVSSTG
jgi:AcrR family transcriptional regulator